MMKVAVFVVALALGAAPVLSADCRYVSSHDLGTLKFLNEDSARLELVGAEPDLCGVNEGDDGGDVLVCVSDDQGSLLNFAASTFGGPDHDELLVLWDHVWYRRCE